MLNFCLIVNATKIIQLKVALIKYVLFKSNLFTKFTTLKYLCHKNIKEKGPLLSPAGRASRRL